LGLKAGLGARFALGEPQSRYLKATIEAHGHGAVKISLLWQFLDFPPSRPEMASGQPRGRAQAFRQAEMVLVNSWKTPKKIACHGQKIMLHLLRP
jgi:hypothetical protein